MNRNIQVLLFILSLLQISCSSVKVGEYSDVLPEGIIYYLPKSIFDISVTRELVACPNDASNPDFKVKITSTVKTSTVADAEHPLVINYDDLSKISKTGKLEITLSEMGILQSINIKAEDHSGKIISDTVSGLGKLIKTATGIPTAMQAVGKVPQCHVAAVEALSATRTIKKNLKTKNKQLEDVKKELEALKKEKDPEEKKKKLSQYEKDLKNLADEIVTLQKNGRQALELISQTQSVQLLPDFYGNNVALTVPSSLLDAWYVKHERSTYPEINELDVYVTLHKPVSVGLTLDKLMKKMRRNEKEQYLNAFIYRQPINTILTICQSRYCQVNGAGDVPLDKRLYSKSVPVPQMGYLATLPYKNKMFAKNGLKVDFYPNGGIKTFTHEDEASVGAGAAKTFSDSAEVVYDLDAERRAMKDARKAEKETEKTTELSRKKDELEAEKAVLVLELEVKKAQDELNQYSSGE